MSRKHLGLALISLLAIAIVSYLLWPFQYILTVTNSRGQEVLANVAIMDSAGKLVFNGSASQAKVALWKGAYGVSVSAEGYEAENFVLANKIGFKLNKVINQTMVLEPKIIRLSNLKFVDPTTTISISPTIRAVGKNVFGEPVDVVLAYDGELVFGTYALVVSDDLFREVFLLAGEILYHGGKQIGIGILEPNELFVRLSASEVGNAFNFVRDFLNLSSMGIIDASERGFPRQFYVYKKNSILSLGKLVFLYCLNLAYEDNAVAGRIYFAPKDQNYHVEGAAFSASECYSAGLKGSIPQRLGDGKTQDAIYMQLLNTTRSSGFGFGDLNVEKRAARIAFTFDIESGRYVPRRSNISISPCSGANYSLGIDANKSLCNDPGFVAWFSPQAENSPYSEYPYPFNSGILGFNEILDYSERYGIPTTDFMVSRDVTVFNALAPGIMGRARSLVMEGLVEVGSHTNYHSELGLVSYERALNEVLTSKAFLENFFNTSVAGFRAPYFSEAQNSTSRHVKLLELANFSYYSQAPAPAGRIGGSDLVYKPWNVGHLNGSLTSYQNQRDFTSFMNNVSFVITLDHPWNLIYRDGPILVPDPAIKGNMRALILVAISNGGIPVKARDIDVG